MLFVALLPYLILVAAHWRIGPIADSGDYAQYILHAKALAEGRPYADIGYIYTPQAFAVGPRVQPPGFPLTLAPIVAVFGVDTPLLKILVAVTGAAFLLISGAYVTRVAGVAMGAATVAVAGVALEAAFATNTVLPDLGFGALLWATFLAMESPKRSAVARVGLAAVLGLTAITYRAAGLALVPAIALYGLLNRDRRSAALAVLGVWLLPTVAVFAIAPDSVPFSAQLLPSGGQLWRRLIDFADSYWRPVLWAQLYPLPGDRPNDVFHVVSSLFLLFGLAVLMWRRRFLIIWPFAVTYGLMLAVAPVRDGRYLWPLFPVVALGLVFGVREALARLLRTPRLTALVSTGLVVLLVSAAGVRALRSPAPRTLEQDTNLQAMFEWLRGVTAEEAARVMFANPRVLTLETGAQGMAIVPSHTPAVLLSQLERNRITHVVEGDPATVVRGQATLAAMIEAYPDRFTLQFESPPYRIHRFYQPGVSTAFRR